MVFLRFRLEGPMLQRPAHLAPFGHEGMRSLIGAMLHEAFPYIIDGLLRRMGHILGIEAIVAQLIHHHLVGWEVDTPFRYPAAQLVDDQQQRGLAQLVAVQAIFRWRTGLTVNSTRIRGLTLHSRSSSTTYVSTISSTESR